ncbi:uncharacterized protein VDAG_09171 [Verticillium dahliae VdLs.17]|uniref:Uncharacterized protein n=1 Tax=Verticillium dahliae (strain VdLs.17 / ATCC MYA-4575 / FGSC 10137) TaxID=498257 RepID=G2XFP7_VERDV|nr:uncharacterized protein VDAG_09171 [Verticillium dahliae VdLs.17]EGY18645.1 hypothetical protein VDAG_09171 [Verticillium dahliae VdLs.17]
MDVMPVLVSKNIIEQTMFSALSLLPVHIFPSVVSLFFKTLLVVSRLPLFFIAISAYGTLLQWLPDGSVGKKLALLTLMGIFGIWWTDLQINGVRRGSLAQQPSLRLPHGGSVILASATSPINAVYLAAAFDPIFTMSCPGTRKVCRLGLLQAILHAFQPIENYPPDDAALNLETLLAEHPARAIVVFLDYATTNSKGIVHRSSNLVSIPPSVNAFRVSIQYTPPNVTTLDHGGYLAFLWILLSRPLHRIRVRIIDDMNKDIALSQSDKTNRGSANLLTRHNGDGPSRRSGSRATRRRTSKWRLSVLGVIEE